MALQKQFSLMTGRMEGEGVWMEEQVVVKPAYLEGKARTPLILCVHKLIDWGLVK